MFNEEMFEVFKKYSQRYRRHLDESSKDGESANIYVSDSYLKRYDKCLRLLSENLSIGMGTNMRAIIGFNIWGNPVWWDVRKPLLAYGNSGSSIALSCYLPVVSLSLAYTKKEFLFYSISGDAVCWNPKTNINCAGSFGYEEGYNTDEHYIKLICEIIDTVNARLKMSEEELAEQPFILILYVFRIWFLSRLSQSPGAVEKTGELFGLLFKHYKKIKFGIFVVGEPDILFGTTKLDIEYKNYIPFCKYLDKFKARLCGRITRRGMAKKLKTEYCGFDSLGSNNRILSDALLPAKFTCGKYSSDIAYEACFDSVIKRYCFDVGLYK